LPAGALLSVTVMSGTAGAGTPGVAPGKGLVPRNSRSPGVIPGPNSPVSKLESPTFGSFQESLAFLGPAWETVTTTRLVCWVVGAVRRICVHSYLPRNGFSSLARAVQLKQATANNETTRMKPPWPGTLPPTPVNYHQP